MSHPNQGESLDLRRLLRVHRLFAAVPMALRPGALLLATFVVLVLSLGGRLWDGIRGPVIEPPGLLRAIPTDATRNAVRSELFAVMSEFIPRDERPPEMQMNSIDPRWLAGALDAKRRGPEAAAEPALAERLHRALAKVESLSPRGTFAATSLAVSQLLDLIVAKVVTLSPVEAASAFGALVVDLPVDLWQRDRGFVVFYGVFALILVSIGGGALCRMTAVAIAERPALAPADAMSFSLARWTSFAFAELLPPLFVGGLFLVGGVVGLLMRVPLLDIIGGALYGIALFFGFLAALAGILWAVGLPISTPAGACDGADAIESNQRAWAYILRRPLLALGYLAAGVVAWALGLFVVELVAVVTMNITAASGTWLSGAPALSGAGQARLFGVFESPAPALGGTSRLAAGLVDFWQQVVRVLVSGAALGLFWSIATAAYLCLRNACDDQPYDDLWDPEEPSGVRVESG